MTIHGKIEGYKYEIDNESKYPSITIYRIEATEHNGARSEAERLLRRLYDEVPALENTNHRFYGMHRSDAVSKSLNYDYWDAIFMEV